MTSTPQPRPFDPHTLLPDLLLYCAQKPNRRRWIPFSELSLHPSLADHPPDRLRAAVRLLAAGWMLEDYRETDTAFRTSGLTQLGILRAGGSAGVHGLALLWGLFFLLLKKALGM
ncbi:MAG: hypothetical protein IJC43_01890 [Clostridia bacterium]|nr:hypothetical protein [Clostridia bacterium]